jgi:site-specific DNA recombinase
MKKAIRYLRFSSDGQSQHSIERQEVITSHWTSYNGVIITDTFTDEGYSARHFDRPDIKLLFEFVRKNYRGIDYLVVAELTRFSREAGDAINMVKKIQAQYGIRIVSAGRGAIYDCLDHNSFFMMGLEFLLGNSENIKRINDINGGIYTAKSKGLWVQGGPAPFGFIKDFITEAGKKRMVLKQNPDQVPVIRYIFESFLSSTPIYIIEQSARAMGFPLTGKSSIQDLLKNPLCAGYHYVKPWKEHPGGLVPMRELEPIVDMDTWNKVQEKFREDDKPRISMADEMPLRGVLHCHCNKLLTGAPSRSGSGKYIYYYKCQAKGHNNINAVKAHNQLQEALGWMSLPERVAVALRQNSERVLEERTISNKKVLQKKKAEFDQVEAQIQSVEEKWINNQLSHETYHRWYSDLTRKRIIVKSEIEKLNKLGNHVYFLLQNNLQKLTDLQAMYQSAATLQKQELLRMVFDNSLYYKDKVYRTTYLMPVFTHNTLILKQKQLLIIDGSGANPGEVDAIGLLSNQFVDFLSVLDLIRVA